VFAIRSFTSTVAAWRRAPGGYAMSTANALGSDPCQLSQPCLRTMRMASILLRAPVLEITEDR
jgi:hypothetical protein